MMSRAIAVKSTTDMQLPNPDQALIPFEKLEGYSLNPNHPEGRHKAIVFRSALDIGLEEAEELRLALQRSISTDDILLVAQTLYGRKYRIDFEMTRAEKQAIIRSVWIVRQNEDFPRLVTCYIL
jgi:hypothetical protein